MSGLDQMMQRIADAAEVQAAQIAADAEVQADAVRAEAAAAADAARAEIEARAAAERSLARERTKSAAEQQRRTLLLRTRQALIAETLESARASLLALPDADYFAFLETVLDAYAQPQSGLLCLNAADRGRMPADFPAKAAAIAAAHGGTLTVSDEARPIDGGFVLVYGGIEENCSVRALFDARQEALQDLTNRLLFA